jgi:predicted component of type VI protein secretion system
MLLRPQHFQHNDRYYDHQMKTRTQLLGGYTWGFLNLEIDLQFLNMGKLVISEASGIPTPATIPPVRSAAVARISNCCSASSRAIRPM